MIAKYIILSKIISVVSDNILRICDIKQFIVLLYTLSEYNSLLIRYKVCSSDPRECLCTQGEVMVKPMKTFVLIQYHVEKTL